MSTLSQQQQQRLQWLQQHNQQKLQAKQDAMQQAAQAWEQYRPVKEKVNTKEVLNNWGVTKEKSIKRLSDLYQEMYNIRQNRPDLMADVDKVYQQVWYNSMSNQQKEIVDYFLWGKQFSS